MSIKLTPYDTFACHSFLMKKTIDALEDAFVMGHLVPSADDPRVLLVEGGAPVVDKIPAFAHPISFNPRNEEQGYIAIDVRYFGKYGTNSGQLGFVVRNRGEYDLAQYRAKLTRIWETEFPTILQNVSDIPLAVYASWISEGLSRKYMLEPREQLNLQVLAAYFYCCLFLDEQDMTESAKLKLAGRISRAIRTSVNSVLEIIEPLSVIAGIQQFCSVAPGAVGSIRLTQLNPGTMYTILQGSWFGVNSPEIVATAIEHPPTWLSILMAAFDDRSYRNTPISKIAERSSGRAGQGTQFTQAVKNMIRATNT